MRLYDRAADVTRFVYDRRIAGPPVLDLAGHFPGAADFVRAWREIRDEAAGVAAALAQVPRFHEIMPEQASISANDRRDWRLFILKACGVKVARNMARCPRLAALVVASPDVLSASLSFMARGSTSRRIGGRSAACCASTCRLPCRAPPRAGRQRC